jgi:hypothetical protein
MKLPDKMVSPPVPVSGCYSRWFSVVNVAGRPLQFSQPGCFINMPRRAKTCQGEMFLAPIVWYIRLLHHTAACAKTWRKAKPAHLTLTVDRLMQHTAACAEVWRKTKQAHLTFTVDQAAPAGNCTSGRAGSR